MEAFSLLKYWRGGAGLPLHSSSSSSSSTTVLTDTGDDGPFFDIEFSLPDDVEDAKHIHHNEQEQESGCECEREFNLVQLDDPNISHDLFFNGNLLHVVDHDDEPIHKPHHFISSSKFRLFMSSLKKSKSVSSHSLPPQSSPKNNKNKKKESSAEEKQQRFSKEAMQKYLKMVKPFYVKVSRSYGDKLNNKVKHDPEAVKVDSSSSSSNSTNNKTQKVTAGLRVVCKHLGKSRSASSAVAAAAATAPPLLSSKRRDDSLLQQQDGIQGAILHCKTSFNASTEAECEIPRFVNEPLHEK